MPTDLASGPPPAEQNAGCLPALKLMLRLFARNVPFQTLLNFVQPVQTHGKVRINTGVMPVINNKNGMTNQSGIAITCRLTGECLQEDERKCRQHQGQGRVPQYQRWHFAHCQRTGITTRFMLLLLVTPRFAAASTAPLHFCTSGCCAPV